MMHAQACRTALVMAIELALPMLAFADNTTTLREVVVTGASMRSPLVVETDLKVPRQPLPAHDGADYLKTIPGFSVTRKGGADGDPVFRGMSGSRLNILVDGQTVLGGCNYRMDAPTAYIFPEAYDKLTVIKGPQSVLYGAGGSAATVMFDRDVDSFQQPGYRIHASALAASFGRHDEVVDGQVGNPRFYLQMTGTQSRSGDYRDGDGNKVHSAYQRYSGNAALGFTPDQDTRLELSFGKSDGHAAYADRSMDGTQFERENLMLKFDRKNISPLVEKIEAQVYQNKIDHVMDDQELRHITGMMAMGYANLTRDTQGGRAAISLRPSEALQLTLGVDAQKNSHDSRNSLNPATGRFAYGAFSPDAEFSQTGLFSELRARLDPHQRLIGGYRADWWKATDQRNTIIAYTMMGKMPLANPSAQQTRKDTLHSGFIRYEQDLPGHGLTAYAGLGHAERFPDYWEMISKQGVSSVSAFTLRPEKTDQLDLGLIYQSGPARVNVSAFYNRIDDFILVDYTSKDNGASRNIDASSYGAELGLDYAVSAQWKVNGSLAHVRGSNRSDHTALAQTPPLEGRIGVSYDNQVWSFGALTRLVAAQNRYDKNKGNIVGKDLGASGGFAVFSMNMGWRPDKRTLISAGVDNLFDKKYAEFVSRAGGNGMGGAIPGYAQTSRVNEPGRTFWLKANVSLE